MRPAPQYSHHYPTELGLLNLAIIDAEKIIDILYKNIKAKFHKKTRTDLNLAIIEYLVLAKQDDLPEIREEKRFTNNSNIAFLRKMRYDWHRASAKEGIGHRAYLTFLRTVIYQKNLAHIEQLIELGAIRKKQNKKQYKTLLVVAEIYRPQQKLF